MSLNGSTDLAVVDLVAASVGRYVTIRLRPHDLLWAPDGRLWVTGWDASWWRDLDVKVVSGATGVSAVAGDTDRVIWPLSPPWLTGPGRFRSS